MSTDSINHPKHGRALRLPTRRHLFRALFAASWLLPTAFVVVPNAQIDRTGRQVSGFVVAAATQQPVPNAQVRYEEVGQPSQATVTDANGYFELSAGQVGVITVTARYYGTARRRWPPPGRTLLVELVAPSVLSGTVTDLATGRLLPALVALKVQHPHNFLSHTLKADNGTFEFTDLPSGSALLTTWSEGFAPFIGSVTVEAGEQRDVRVGMLLGAQGTGHVVDSTGQPVPSAFVSVEYPGLAGGHILRSFIGGQPLTGSDGAFALEGLVPDTPIVLQAELDGRRSATETVTVAPGMRRVGIVLTLP